MIKVGDYVSWLHGLHSHRVAKVLKIENGRVQLEGTEKTYWMKLETLERKINKPFPRGADYM